MTCLSNRLRLRAVIVSLALALPVSLGAPASAASDAPKPAASSATTPACYITVHGMIDGGLASSVKRRTDRAVKKGAQIIFYEIDTWGGLVDAALDITDTILAVKDVKTVAYVPPRKKAISAGALIAMSCREIVMGQHTTLGDCEPIIPTGETGMLTAPEKIQTMLRAKFRSFAERNGYPVALAEAMVSKDTAVYRVTFVSGEVRYLTGGEINAMSDAEKKTISEKKQVLAEGRLLTMTDTEALEFGFARKVVSSKDELFKLYPVNAAAIATYETNWSEEMVRFIESISPILMLIGMVAIYLEFKYPGTLLFAGIAVLCFGLVFLSKYMVGLAEKAALLLFIVGFCLILIEIFLLPGFLIPGFLGITLLIAGLVLASQPFVIPQTPYEFDMIQRNFLWVMGTFVSSIFLFIFVVKLLPRTPAYAWTVLSLAETQTSGYTVALDRDKQLIGKVGVAISPLHPAGRAQIDGEVLDVVTQGDFIERGKRIRVKEAAGNRVVVEPV